VSLLHDHHLSEQISENDRSFSFSREVLQQQQQEQSCISLLARCKV